MYTLCTPPSTGMLFTRLSEVVSITSTTPGSERIPTSTRRPFFVIVRLLGRPLQHAPIQPSQARRDRSESQIACRRNETDLHPLPAPVDASTVCLQLGPRERPPAERSGSFAVTALPSSWWFLGAWARDKKVCPADRGSCSIARGRASSSKKSARPCS